MKPNPVYREIRKAFCARRLCEMFRSGAESGWGVYEKCLCWEEEKHGRKPRYFDHDTECKPAEDLES